jgi:23S rRNA (uridine2552-2'-O)-methyltransferase
MAGGRRGAGPGGPRHEGVRLRTARGRKLSSQNWLKRQLNDPYVAEARRLGYRSRAAFKLIEIDDRARLLKPGKRVVDLGAAPGGWTQVAVARVRAGEAGGGRVVALDIAPMDPVPGATVLTGDFMADDAPVRLKDALDGPADIVLSDMSPAASGHRQTDHLRIMGLVEAAAEFAGDVLAPGGAFVAKVFEGGAEAGLLQRLKRDFAAVRHIKPPASRKESAEMYLVATGFRGSVRL